MRGVTVSEHVGTVRRLADDFAAKAGEVAHFERLALHGDPMLRLAASECLTKARAATAAASKALHAELNKGR